MFKWFYGGGSGLSGREEVEREVEGLIWGELEKIYPLVDRRIREENWGLSGQGRGLCGYGMTRWEIRARYP